jgi:hypothetical protein
VGGGGGGDMRFGGRGGGGLPLGTVFVAELESHFSNAFRAKDTKSSKSTFTRTTREEKEINRKIYKRKKMQNVETATIHICTLQSNETKLGMYNL